MTDPSLEGLEGPPAAPASPGAAAAPAPAPGWGAAALAPLPVPNAGGSSGMRTTILSAVIMIGVVFGVNVVNAAVPLPQDPGFVDPGPAASLDLIPPAQNPNQPTMTSVDPGPLTPGAGLQVGAGVVIYPPGGWTALGAEDGVTVLQKGGVVLIAAGIAWGGTPVELAAAYRDSWFQGGQFAANDPESGSVGNGVPGAALSYSGILEGTQVEGILVSGATGGAGVILNVFGAQGSLNGVSNDLNSVFGTVQFTGGQG